MRRQLLAYTVRQVFPHFYATMHIINSANRKEDEKKKQWKKRKIKVENKNRITIISLLNATTYITGINS